MQHEINIFCITLAQATSGLSTQTDLFALSPTKFCAISEDMARTRFLWDAWAGLQMKHRSDSPKV